MLRFISSSEGCGSPASSRISGGDDHRGSDHRGVTRDCVRVRERSCLSRGRGRELGAGVDVLCATANVCALLNVKAGAIRENPLKRPQLVERKRVDAPRACGTRDQERIGGKMKLRLTVFCVVAMAVLAVTGFAQAPVGGTGGAGGNVGQAGGNGTHGTTVVNGGGGGLGGDGARPMFPHSPFVVPSNNTWQGPPPTRPRMAMFGDDGLHATGSLIHGGGGGGGGGGAGAYKIYINAHHNCVISCTGGLGGHADEGGKGGNAQTPGDAGYGGGGGSGGAGGDIVLTHGWDCFYTLTGGQGGDKGDGGECGSGGGFPPPWGPDGTPGAGGVPSASPHLLPNGQPDGSALSGSSATPGASGN